ncbi:hypothetical protein VB773_08260 [Haloarculaceae archaeon H-GB2-1]|nr:hypothetical protein [Haloarculaceae archaeon H-GB11]MEA5407558.1 hypothetical protein [Haloarculaceae archaeon H-GB2-1]
MSFVPEYFDRSIFRQEEDTAFVSLVPSKWRQFTLLAGADDDDRGTSAGNSSVVRAFVTRMPARSVYHPNGNRLYQPPPAGGSAFCDSFRTARSP